MRAVLALLFVAVMGIPAAFAASAPAAFYVFCAKNPRECSTVGERVSTLHMDAARWGELRQVNLSVNRSVKEVSDKQTTGRADVWRLPTNGQGDCEDFALLKRHELLALGWPSSVLLMTVARDRQGTGHAILTVATNEGDFVLDNKTGNIVRVEATGYRFFSRQSSSNPLKWVALSRDGRPAQAVAMAGNENRPM